MKQIIQDLRHGDTILEEVPAPLVKKGHILIRTHRSLVSLGTEKMLVEFGKGSIISKARSQPEKVKQVLNKIKTEGLMPTLEAVFNKLDEPLPLGYCNAGEVIAIGENVNGFSVGDRVANNGPHAEFVSVPQNLAALIPKNVTYEQAAFTVIGSIGLQGIRLANPTFGETIVVIGLGLIGLITAELLVSSGCNVIGFDFDQDKIKLANKRGVKAFSAKSNDPVSTVKSMTKDIGADAVIITASTPSNDVISQAANMSRIKGRIVLVGVIGLNINRADFYKKELSFQVSCSYGPGRYDDFYEQKGIDYPIGYVRWTEQRNFEAILDALSKKTLKVNDLITKRLCIDDYNEIYNNLKDPGIASILEYSNDSDLLERTIISKNVEIKSGKGVIGIIGAGNFTKMVIVPNLKKIGAKLKYIASASGLTAKSLANKYGFEYTTSDYKEILGDKSVDTVFITTRHNKHASMVLESLKSEKHVFVEKPLAINQKELDLIFDFYQKKSVEKILHVGFNRRFSPHAIKVKNLLGDASDMNIVATMNAGYIPPDVWVHDMKVGGGRIIGEACHFIDLMIFITGSLVESVNMSILGKKSNENSDNAIITIKFRNGSQGVINYFANGSKNYPKERIEIYSQNKTLVIDNFKKTQGYGFKGFSILKTKLDKGHVNQFKSFLNSVEKGTSPLIPFEEIYNSSKAVLCAIESLRSKTTINI